MGIYGAMYSGVSGLAAQSNALGIISDNISNVNTVGYKGSHASFQTLVTQAATSTTYSPGGVQSSPLQGVDQQGLLQGTSSATDLAVNGNGFFVVNESANPGTGDDYMFTRAGEFRTDKDGNLVNSAGYYLQGWPLDNNGNLPAAQQAIGSVETVNVDNLSGLPRATDSMELGANLPSSGLTNGDTFQSTAQIFDSLGNPHDVTFQFEYDAGAFGGEDWEITVSTPNGTPSFATTPQFSFNGDGSPNTDLSALTLDVTGWSTGANNSSISVDFGNQNAFDGLTNFNTDFTGFTELNQNGLKFGNYTGVNINDKGVVTAVFDNGRRKDIYQLPVAIFNNPNGLEARTGNAYLQTNESGDYLLSEAGVGGAGEVAPSSLEASTVDLAEEFTNMITTQRAYSAATKVITTSDEMLQELTQAIR